MGLLRSCMRGSRAGVSLENERYLGTLAIPVNELRILKALYRGEVEYLLIGGQAMRWYGATRATADVDLLANPTLENGRRFINAVMSEIGHAPGFSEKMFANRKTQILFDGDGYRMSVITSVDGLEFENAYQERQFARQARVVIPVVSRRHLVFIKRIAAKADPARRDKEISDIEFLES